MKEFVKMDYKSDMDLICVAQRGRNYGGGTMQQLETAPYPNKTNCLTTVSKDNLILQRPRGANNGGFHAHKSPTLSANSWEQNNLVAEMETDMKVGTYRTYKVDGGFRPMANNTKSPALVARARQDGSGQPCILMGGDATTIRIRRLTPKECAKLQTIPSWYKWEVSETQQYKMLGNGWTVEVIKHILSFLPDELKK